MQSHDCSLFVTSILQSIEKVLGKSIFFDLRVWAIARMIWYGIIVLESVFLYIFDDSLREDVIRDGLSK